MIAEKIFYSISEVADATDLPKYVIRFWETEFSEISPDRRAGRRYYRQADIDVILNIKDLLYKQGFTIKGAKKFLHDSKSSQKTKVFSDFKIDEDSKSLEPVQETKILTKFNFVPPEENKSKVDIEKIIQKLSDIESILKE